MLLERYIESQVYRGAVENVACEMASKMVAMKAATDNAGKFIEGLQLQYNKARQATITRETQEARTRLVDAARELARLVVGKLMGREVRR